MPTSSRLALLWARTVDAIGAAPEERPWVTKNHPPRPRKRRVAIGLGALLCCAAVVAGATTEGRAASASSGLAPLAIRLSADQVAQGTAGTATLDPPAAVQPLPAATSSPQPLPAADADAAPLASHEVFAFAPYWALSQEQSFDVAGISTIAYFSIELNPNGTLYESGSGWDGYQSQALVDLISRAHAAGDRVVLTVSCFDQDALDQLTSSPTAATTLAHALIGAIEAKDLDGVNLDLEGVGSADQQGLTGLVATVSSDLKGVDPDWQVTMDTYASSAGDPNGFFDIKALAPYVDAFFVMAYELNLGATQSATSPLTSGDFSNTLAATQYAADVPGSKVILGLPYYGYAWPTTTGTLDAGADGPPTIITSGQELTSGHPVYWDAVTDTAWTSYQVGGQWYEAFFEDPYSLYLATEMAEDHGLAGVGSWALGMDSDDDAMTAALDGNAPPARDLDDGPLQTASSSKATSPASTSSSTGQWLGDSVTLVEVRPHQPGSGAVLEGQLQGFQTGDSALSCLQGGAGIEVWRLRQNSSHLFAIAAQPANCIGATFMLENPPGSGDSVGTAP